MSILKTALEAIEFLTTDNTTEAAQAAAADARIKLMNSMTQVDFIAVPRDGAEPLMGLSLSEQEDELAVEPVAWAMRRADGLILDVICPDEHESYEGEYTIPLYLHPPQQAKQVPMTDVEIYTVMSSTVENPEPLEELICCEEWPELVDVIRRIEKHHGIGGEA